MGRHKQHKPRHPRGTEDRLASFTFSDSVC